MPSVLDGTTGWDDATPQAEEDATAAKMISPDEGLIDVKETTAKQAKDRIRAFDMWPGCHIYIRVEGEEEVKKLKIGQGKALEGEWEGEENATVGKWGAKIRCKGNTGLELLKVQPEGKKMMDGKSWVNGLKGKGFSVVAKE